MLLQVALGRCLAAFGLAGSEYASADELTVALLSQGIKEDENKKFLSLDKIKVNKRQKTKLNKLYSDWKTENDKIEKSFNDRQKTIQTNGGQHGKSKW